MHHPTWTNMRRRRSLEKTEGVTALDTPCPSSGWIHYAHRATCSFLYVPWFPLGPSWSGASAPWHASDSGTQNAMCNGQAWKILDGLKPAKWQCSVSCVGVFSWNQCPAIDPKARNTCTTFIYYSHNRSAKNMAPLQCAGDRGSKGPARTLPSAPGWASKVCGVSAKKYLKHENTQIFFKQIYCTLITFG